MPSEHQKGGKRKISRPLGKTRITLIRQAYHVWGVYGFLEVEALRL